jgi:hypothetical protein
MNRLPLLVALLAVGATGRAVDKVPDYEITDTYVTGPTMLLRAGNDTLIKEIWSGMDVKRMRHVPLFLETSVFGEIRVNGEWQDLRKLRYHQAGTRPGFIHLSSEDGAVSMEVTSRKGADLSPIFVKYSFREAVDFRLSARFKYPEFTQGFHAEDRAGFAAFSTRWRDVNPTLATTNGPRLVLATEPLGKTLSIDGTGMVKEIDATHEVLLCIDATDLPVDPAGPSSYIASWISLLGGYRDSEAEVAANRVSLTSDDRKLDRLFGASIDAIVSHQFVSGDVMADVFFYRDSWLRDGTYTMMGLSLAGDYAAVDRYFDFWNAQRDFSVGGEREAQQAAIAITGMWYYSLLSPNGSAFLEKVWPYVKYYGDYYEKRVESEGMLNLAEEWICFIPAPSSWPNAEVYSGLRAAAKIAEKLGNTQGAQQWNKAADRLKRQFSLQAYDRDKGRIIPMAGPAGQSFTDPEFPKAESRNGPLRDDRVDAGMLIIGRLEAFGRDQGIISVDDPKYASTRAQIVRDLENPDHSIFRFGPNPSSPHAPQGELDTWPIIMSWAAQDEWLLGRTDLAWRYLISGVVNKQGYDLRAANYYLPENWDRQGVPDKPLIVWSHGEFVTSTLLLFLGVDLEPQAADLGLAPSLAPGMNHAQINNFRFRNWRLNFELARRHGKIDVRVKATDTDPADKQLSIRLPFGKILALKPGQSAQFTVDPRQYYRAFGRFRNAGERAMILEEVLGGKEPSRNLAKMKAAEQEAFMVNLETSYVPTAR